MGMTSYAQNYEDVMLHRALKNISGGFYIDVGAWSPILDSVTKHFYDAGWSGINVEPNEVCFEELKECRPRDTNVHAGVGDVEGETTLFIAGNSGLTNFVAPPPQLGTEKVEVTLVRVTTLNKIFIDFIKPSQEVHFLKIDVEGYEKKVIEGNDWSVNRPWIVVVESFLPMTQTPSHAEWEFILLSNNYHYIYCDGVNRFYISEEHSDLKGSFEFPPNYFDYFEKFDRGISIELAKFKDESESLKLRLNKKVEDLTNSQRLNVELENQSMQLNDEIAKTRFRLTAVEDELQRVARAERDTRVALTAMTQSMSWALTAPIRYLANRFQFMSFQRLTVRVIALFGKYPALIWILPRLRFAFPKLSNFVLVKAGLIPGLLPRFEGPEPHVGPLALNERAREIYLDLAQESISS